MPKTIKLKNDIYIANDVYFTRETIIGKYGDEDLYRRIIYFTPTGNNYEFDISILNYDYIRINYTFTRIRDYVDMMPYINVIANNIQFAYVQILPTKKVRFLSNESSFYDQQFEICLEYTKMQ